MDGGVLLIPTKLPVSYRLVSAGSLGYSDTAICLLTTSSKSGKIVNVCLIIICNINPAIYPQSEKALRRGFHFNLKCT